VIDVIPLPAELLGEWWPHVAGYAEQMATRFPDDWPTEETKRQAGNGTLVLWLVWDKASRERFGAIGTHIHLKPSGRRILSVSWAAGRQHRKWARLADDVIAAYGRANGCQVMAIEGRGGWARAVDGYRSRPWSILTKEL
jgi:hypothetical protein